MVSQLDEQCPNREGLTSRGSSSTTESFGRPLPRFRGGSSASSAAASVGFLCFARLRDAGATSATMLFLMAGRLRGARKEDVPS